MGPRGVKPVLLLLAAAWAGAVPAAEGTRPSRGGYADAGRFGVRRAD